jgi:hypothetical protein
MSRTYHHRRYARPSGVTPASNRAFRTNAKRALRGGSMHHVRGYRDAFDFDVCTRHSDARRIASPAEWEGWQTWADNDDAEPQTELL